MERVAESADAIGSQERRPAYSDAHQKRRARRDDASESGSAGNDQNRVASRAEQNDRQNMTSKKPLAQDEGILRSDGNDQPCPQRESLQSDPERRWHGATNEIDRNFDTRRHFGSVPVKAE